MKRCCRIVLTGGPGGGKTTAADLYRREIGDQVVVVPEAATLLYTGGFPRPTSHPKSHLSCSDQPGGCAGRALSEPGVIV